jgi:hypothetical protein
MQNAESTYGYGPAFLARMSSLSAELQAVGDARGLSRGETIRRVDRLARAHGLRAWSDTRGEADYNALIAALRTHLSS